MEYNTGMILTDVHTHSTFSADGDSPLEEMVARARELGLGYFGVSEHFDYDYPPAGLVYADGSPAGIDEEGYFARARALQKQYVSENFCMLVGCEFGYTDDPEAQRRYAGVIQKYSPDFIVNSVHTCDGADCWFGEYFGGKDKLYAYGRYLKRVLESLSKTAQNDLANLITLLLGITIAFSMRADQFVQPATLMIMGLGLVAFVLDSVVGVLFVKVLNIFTPKNKINPMVGAAGISAFPMSSRVIEKLGQEADSQNHLLMHAVAANVSGQIASVVAGGVVLQYFANLG